MPVWGRRGSYAAVTYTAVALVTVALVAHLSRPLIPPPEPNLLAGYRARFLARAAKQEVSWRIADAVFVGDTLFAPDYGTARCDFPHGSAEQLYDSIQRLYALPDHTRLLLCHDYRPGGRPVRWETTVAEQKAANIQLNARTTKAEFVAFRTKRDAQLELPVLILPSLQVNIRAGHLPEPESNGVSYLKIPLNAL